LPQRDVVRRQAMRQFAHDLRYAARALSKAPLFTAVAVVSLGLALALNTTMFALADAVLHPYVPYPSPERIAIPSFRGGNPKQPVPLDVRLRAIRDGMHSYERIASYTFITALVQSASTAEDQTVMAVSPEFFAIAGVHALAGRTFGAADSGATATAGAVISFRLWNRLFNGRPLRDTLTLDVGPYKYTVVGVMPRSVHFPFGDADIWLPFDAVPSDPSLHRRGPFSVMRLKPGVTVEAARAELATIGSRLTTELTPKHPLSTWLSPILAFQWSWWNGFPSFMLGFVAMVLVIACANLGTMMIARGMARRRETAIRIAVGAGRRDIIRGVLTECTLIVGAGVTLGMLLTGWSLYVLPHFTIPWVPQLGDLDPVPSWRVFSFAFAVAAATVFVAGALPALRAATTDPAEPMKEAAGTTTGRLRDRYNPLIVLEVALSTTLLMSSAIFVLVAVRLVLFDFRYAAKRLVVADLQPTTKQLSDTAVTRFYADAIKRARALPGARLAATHHWSRPDGPMVFAEEGKSGETWMNLDYYKVVSPDFLRTFGISIVRGRDFEPGDERGTAPVVIVDEQAASRLWPDIREPVGRMIKLGRKESMAPWLRVIGVAASIEYEPRTDLDLPPFPVIYVVVPHDAARPRQLVVQGNGVGGDRGRAALALELRREIQATMPELGSVWVRPWLDSYESRRAASAFMASLFGAFAGFGLVLCAVGLYGVLAYTVSRRLREFAVRIALGARRRDVARLVVHDAAVTALAGVGIGAFIALWITRSISDAASGIDYADAIALVASEAILFSVALVAALGPVHQAAKADPIEILRAS
jgi:predicted permease